MRIAVVTLFLTLLASPFATAQTETPIAIDAHAAAHPFPHFWDEMFGSGRAILALRQNYLDDLKDVHDQIGMRYVRFHAILHDEVGVYDEDKNGNPVFNWTYVDQIHAFARHLVDRYGIDEVAQWYFEVWNEPNIDFWAGEPKQVTYFELYDHTARDLKEVSPKLRVGGPSTAAAHWIPEFLNHVNSEHVPIDFVSTHGYADDTVKDLFGTDEDIPMRDRVCRAVKKVHDEIGASTMPTLPLMWSEWNVPSYNELGARDNWYVGPALARDISECDGQVKLMSWWTFDDVFEEGGVKSQPFDNGFGLIAPDRIKKPSFYDFALLHELGDERIDNSADNVLVTRKKDGPLVVAAWNLVDMDKLAQGAPVTLKLNFKGVAPRAEVTIQRVDETHGNPLTAYKAMGSPHFPTQTQIAALNAASALQAPEHRKLTNGVLELTLPVNGLAVVQIAGR
jgi:xylan 1,4-beta-xylosidase